MPTRWLSSPNLAGTQIESSAERCPTRAYGRLELPHHPGVSVEPGYREKDPIHRDKNGYCRSRSRGNEEHPDPIRSGLLFLKLPAEIRFRQRVGRLSRLARSNCSVPIKPHETQLLQALLLAPRMQIRLPLQSVGRSLPNRQPSSGCRAPLFSSSPLR